MQANLGIDEKDLREITSDLYKILEQTYDLYTKTQNYHWNITGKLFLNLHKMFETQYADLSEAVDKIAERIRTLGYSVLGTYFNSNLPASMKKESKIMSVNDMMLDLMHGHESIARCARELFLKADKVADFGTENLLGNRIEIHEKTAWIIRSQLID